MPPVTLLRAERAPVHAPPPLTRRLGRPAGGGPAIEALRWVLSGGEDHSLAATFPPGTRLPPRWRVIGAVPAGSGGGPGHGVVVDGQPWAQAPGWDHFAYG